MADPILRVTTVDYHTAGEPFRIVRDGAPRLEGNTILDKRRFARDHTDHIRKLLVNEPRGHADMYGCFVTDPEDGEADLGCVFFHNAGYSTACGHGTIALVTWALEEGIVAKREPETRVVVDVPSGRLETFARVEDDEVVSVRFRNVASFVHSTGHSAATERGSVTADVSYGGAFYASVHAPDVGLKVQAEHLTELIRIGREVKHSLESSVDFVHPQEPELRDIYGVIFFERLPNPEGGGLHQRNVTIFADGEVDRSPCGSGTSARLALLDAGGELERATTLVHEGIVDTTFLGTVVGDAEVGGTPAVITEVEGSAFKMGEHSFVLRENDPLPSGFLLR